MSAFVRAFGIALVVTGLSAAAALAAPQPYTLDKSHTAVTFKVDHLGYSLTHGFFTQFDADIMYDAEKPETSSVTFTIDAASVNTLWEARDENVRGSKFLDVEKNAEIVFKSTKIEMDGAEDAKLTGNLTILGKTNEETFNVKLRKSAASPLPGLKGRVISGFSITGEIDRTAYGMTYAAGAVGNIIPVQVDLEIYPTAQ